MRILVYGCGELASGAVRELAGDGRSQVTVLGDERNQLERLSNIEGVNAVLVAEPVMHDYFMQAGISQMDVFLALSTDDHENLLAAQIAETMFRIPKVVCHVENPQLQVLYASQGLNVLSYSVGILQDIRFAMESQ